MNVGLGKNLVRAGVVVLIASATGACSSVPSWMDPFGDDTPPASDAAAPPPDQTADNAATPDLANVPDRPVATTTPDSQRQVADSLAADRAQATYSSDALRAGSEAAAAPPPPPSAAEMAAASAPDTTPSAPPPAAAPDTTPDTKMASNTPPPSAAPSPATSSAPSPAMSATPPEAAAPSPSDDSGDTVTVPGTASAPPPAAMPAPSTDTASVAPSTTTTTTTTTSVASNYAPPPSMAPGDGRPAVPAVPGAGGSVPGAQAPVMSDAQLGFQPSRAPALDASVSQFVAPSILNRYRQTAGGRALASNMTPATAGSRRSRGPAMGGPEQMSGAVVANLDSLSSPAVTSAPAAYAGATGTPSSVVFFPGDTTILSASAKERVKAAAASFRSGGSTGFVRVVGHASSRTGNMPLERHLVVIFEKSQQRANSVAQELIRDGVPADKILVEAVGDSQPVYYESMPKGEDGNRRAEIFLQS